MSKPVFDAESFVEVDLSQGSIASRHDDRLALISAEVLQMLPQSDDLLQAAADWGRRHGAALEEEIKTQDSDDGLEALAEHLGGTLAVLGLGAVRLEIRGDALLLRTTEGVDRKAPGMRTLVAGFLSGYLSALFDRPFEALDLGESEGERLFWALSPRAAAGARAALLQEGITPLALVDAAVTGRALC